MTHNNLRRVLLMAGLAAWGAAVVLLTLRGQGISTPSFDMRAPCFPCGTRGTSDLILNWILFLPLGLGVAWLWSFRAAVVASLLVTLGIEAFQMFLPGRVPALQDVVTNTLGGLSGAWLAVAPSGRPVRGIAASVALAIWLAPAFLLRPVPSERDLWGQWTSGNPPFEGYTGRVLSATLGESPFPSARIEDATRARTDIEERGPLDVRLVLGSTPRSLSPIVAIYDAGEREQLAVGTLREDLVVRRRSAATVLHLDQPDARWAGAFEGLAEGDTVSLRVEHAEGSLCATIAERRRCGLSPGPGDGWAFLINLEGGNNAVRLLMMAAWSLGVGGLLGLASASMVRAAAAGVGLAVLGLAAGAISLDLRVAPLQALILVAGAVTGALLHPHLVRTASFFRASAS